MHIESKYNIYHQELSKQEEEQAASKLFFPVSKRVQTRQCTYIRVYTAKSCILKIVKFAYKREKTFDILVEFIIRLLQAVSNNFHCASLYMTYILPGDYIRGRDSMVVGFIATYASVSITTNDVSSNPAQARYTRNNFM
jgi:hypothetical protein